MGSRTCQECGGVGSVSGYAGDNEFIDLVCEPCKGTGKASNFILSTGDKEPLNVEACGRRFTLMEHLAQFKAEATTCPHCGEGEAPPPMHGINDYTCHKCGGHWTVDF